MTRKIKVLSRTREGGRLTWKNPRVEFVKIDIADYLNGEVLPGDFRAEVVEQKLLVRREEAEPGRERELRHVLCLPRAHFLGCQIHSAYVSFQ